MKKSDYVRKRGYFYYYYYVLYTKARRGKHYYYVLLNDGLFLRTDVDWQLVMLLREL